MITSVRTVVGSLGAAVAMVVAVPGAASAQAPLPAPVAQLLDQAQAGSAQAGAIVSRASSGFLSSADLGMPAPRPAAPAAPAAVVPGPPDNTPVSPCPRSADACVDLDQDRAWLQEGDRLSYGPVRMSHGMQGWETPTGTFEVTRKVRHEVSRLFNNAPMPYAVYFVGGIAFHQGDPSYASHGCVRLEQSAAATFFNSLEVGDTVVVF